ncbi:deazapurine DNA modification protein DpdA family protein [Burkholderia sp. MBR-1]|uniref:deazapurine DNA modification protein DpdA family protein n=1 Tax=Burkholderia sp. MBR-1 TaxID=2732364 RepID=UPI0015EEDF3A|nr:hypothetical protein [Burkholderia sp. MBR-1]QMI49904.1 hypothetical protein MBR110_31080 [Burkholderia sp. MBR-1]
MEIHLPSTDGPLGRLPAYQRNAPLTDEMVVRVGIPHSGGTLAFHAFKHGYAAMVSAQAFWQPKSGRFRFPSATNLSELDWALDSAGYTAMKLWQAKGSQPGIASVFPWQYAQYVELACLSGATWWASPDMCCEESIASDQQAVTYRVRATATLLEGVLRIVHGWQDELSKYCSAAVVRNMVRPCVPVLQGRRLSDYVESLELTMAVWDRWRPWLASPTLIGLGSVCRRDLHHPDHGLYAILEGLQPHLPPDVRVHLFGVKGAALEKVRHLPFVASVDSMAFDFRARVSARERVISNTMENRTDEMTRWMQAALQRVTGTSSTQLALL